MKNTFYRPEKVNIKEFENILQKMREDLSELISGNASYNEVTEYVRKIITDGKPLERNPNMVFWGLGKPEEMPSDARVDFFYTPTYIAVSILIYIMQTHPDLAIKMEGFEEKLKKGLYAATGRSFLGHGYNDMNGLIDCMDMFATAGVFKFIKEHPDFCPKFTIKLTEALDFLESKQAEGKLIGDWNEDYSSKAASVLRKIKSNNESNKIFVYGTLLRGNSNHDCYLKDSKFLGEAVLYGYGLYNVSSYPGIKRKTGDSVKGELYEIDENTLERINYLEDEGSLYSLVNASVESAGKIINNVGVYVYMHNINDNQYVCKDE